MCHSQWGGDWVCPLWSLAVRLPRIQECAGYGQILYFPSVLILGKQQGEEAGEGSGRVTQAPGGGGRGSAVKGPSSSSEKFGISPKVVSFQLLG